MNSYQGAVGLAFYKSNPLKHGGAVRSCPVLPCADCSQESTGGELSTARKRKTCVAAADL